MHNTTAIFHFTTVDNQPLIISNPIPANQTVNVSKATSYWCVTIEDPENDAFNWTIETSPYIGNASGNNDTTGQKACPLSGVDYNTTYTVYVNATDSVNGTWINETFWFITAEQEAPTISNEYPSDGGTQAELRPTCHVDVHDIEGDTLTIYWYENTTGNWTLRQTDGNISANSTVYWIFSQANSYSTAYYWRVKVNDGTINTTATYYFTTKSKPSGPSQPGGGSYQPPPNQHPIANITGPHIGYTNETLVFYAYYSYDPDGEIIGYRWDFENDGVYDTDWLEDPLITYSYSYPGSYTVRLQVKDDDYAVTTSDPHKIQIIQLEPPLQLPIPQINGPYYGYTNENIAFSSHGSYDPDGSITNYTWDFGDGNKSHLKNPVHLYSKPDKYTVILTVIDNDNLSNATTTKAIIIEKEFVETEEERELPLTVILFLSMTAIATLLVLLFIPRRYRFTLLIEQIDTSKKKKKKNENVENESDKKTSKNIEMKVNKDEDIHAKIDMLLSGSDKKYK